MFLKTYASDLVPCLAFIFMFFSLDLLFLLETCAHHPLLEKWNNSPPSNYCPINLNSVIYIKKINLFLRGGFGNNNFSNLISVGQNGFLKRCTSGEHFFLIPDPLLFSISKTQFYLLNIKRGVPLLTRTNFPSLNSRKEVASKSRKFCTSSELVSI